MLDPYGGILATQEAKFMGDSHLKCWLEVSTNSMLSMDKSPPVSL